MPSQQNIKHLQEGPPAPARLQNLGLRYDPFSLRDAGTMSHESLEETFVAPGGFAEIGALERSVAVFAPPGGGKTAACRKVEAALRDLPAPPPLAVRFNSFQRLGERLPQVTLDDYQAELLAAVSTALFERIRATPDAFLALDNNPRNWLWAFLSEYAQVEPLELLLSEPALRDDYGRRQPLERIFMSGAALDRRLSRLLSHIRPLGLEHLVILLDGLDANLDVEPDQPEATSLERLLRPLLRAQFLFRHPWLVWKLFLPSSVHPFVAKSKLVRDGWLSLVTLNWTPPDLDDLLQRRLEWASDEAISSLEAVSEQDLVLSQGSSESFGPGPGTPLHRRLAEIALRNSATGAARELLRLGSELFAGKQAGSLSRAEWSALIDRYAPAGKPPAEPQQPAGAQPATAPAVHAVCELNLRIDQVQRRILVTEATMRRHGGGIAEHLLQQGRRPVITLDPTPLNEEALNVWKYGQALTTMFFKAPELVTAFNDAYSIASGQDAKLRLRLWLDEQALELHAYRWETLQDVHPTRRGFLCHDERILFSRYLPMRGSVPPVRMRQGQQPAALVAIASPSGLQAYRLDALPVDEIFADLQPYLQGPRYSTLRNPGLESLVRHLTPPPEIFVLVCHSALREEGPVLYLADERGQTKPVLGTELVDHLRSLTRKPALCVLASCQSAGSSQIADQHTLNALGPMLAQIGFGAVLAVAGDLAISTLRIGLPAFLESLQRHGIIDLAVSEMRRQLRVKGEDWWRVILFLGLDDGRLWR